MTSVSADRGRITARVPIQVRETLETASSIVGATVNQFIVQTALREAEHIIEQGASSGCPHATRRHSYSCAHSMPPPPNDELTAILEDYPARRDDQTGTLDWRPRQKRVRLRCGGT